MIRRLIILLLIVGCENEGITTEQIADDTDVADTDCNGDYGGTAVTTGVCGDCWSGNTGLAENYMDTDGDTVCNNGAANGDDDNCPNTANVDQWNYDGDSYGDACDDDDDNDGALDYADSDDNDEYICSDNDNDSCDDCSSGVYNPDNDCP